MMKIDQDNLLPSQKFCRMLQRGR